MKSDLNPIQDVITDNSSLEEGEKVIPTFCAMCGPSTGCGIWAHVKNGKLVRVEDERVTFEQGQKLSQSTCFCPMGLLTPTPKVSYEANWGKRWKV